jgi:hypothetical protein
MQLPHEFLTRAKPSSTLITSKFTQESFWGFDFSDEDVGPGEWRRVAIEIKRIFEEIAEDALARSEEVFLDRELDHALRRFLVDPSNPSLQHLLEVSPILVSTVAELKSLLRSA